MCVNQPNLSEKSTFGLFSHSFIEPTYNVISEINRRGLNMYYDYLSFHEFSYGEGFMALLEHVLKGRGVHL